MRFKQILESCPDSLIDPALDKELKASVSKAVPKRLENADEFYTLTIVN